MNQLDIPPSNLLTLLLLDDEQDIINSLSRVLRKEYNLVTFNQGTEALEYLEKNPIQLIMSDMRMPSMSGAEFLARSRKIQPDAVRLLLTGHSDIESTIKAINEGEIYSYLAKPWDNEDLKLRLSAAAEHYRLKSERDKLADHLRNANKTLAEINASLEIKVSQRTQELEISKQKLQASLDLQKDLLHDILDMLSATIEYRTGLAEGDLKRIASQAKTLATHLNLDETACRNIYLSALIHDIGAVGLNDQALEDHSTPGLFTSKSVADHPVIGATIIGRIKRMAALTENIRHQNENVNGTGRPDHLVGDRIPIGARIIRIVKDFDYLIAGTHNQQKMSIFNAESWMKDKADEWYDKKILNSFLKIITKGIDAKDGEMVYCVGVERLKPGDVLTKDLIINGQLMLKGGQKVTLKLIESLRHHEQNYNTKLTLFTV